MTIRLDIGERLFCDRNTLTTNVTIHIEVATTIIACTKENDSVNNQKPNSQTAARINNTNSTFSACESIFIAFISLTPHKSSY